jgi:Fe-S oxidoreductase
MQLYPKMQSESDKMLNKIDFLKSNSQLQISETGDIGFFVGCFSAMESFFESYDIKYSEIAVASIKILNLGGIKPVIKETKCCGHDNYWMGDVPTAKKLAEYNLNIFKNAGIKTLIVSCAEGYEMWKINYPKLVGKLPFDVKHITEYIVEIKIMDKFVSRDTTPITITYHDPCRLGRLGGIYEAPRQILKKLRGVKLVEMVNIKENAQCCGVSSFLDCTNNSRILREARLKEASGTGASVMITTCPKCITHFNCYLFKQESNSDNNKTYEQISKSIQKIMELITFVARRLML